MEQTFSDLEIVVGDNSDPELTDATRSVVESFGDVRLRYVRTSGTLAMPESWETAVAAAGGTYVGVLTDRSVFRPDALATVRSEIDRTGIDCVSWFSDLYGRDPAGDTLKRRVCTFRRYEIPTRDVLDYFLNGDPKYGVKVVPKLMTAVCRRELLDEIRASRVGRCCPRVCPDFGSGYLILAYSDRILFIDEALYVSCGSGTGSAFRNRSELGQRFRHDLGMSSEELVDRMPSPATFSHALVTNDLLRLRDELPDRFTGVELNRARYYQGCLYDYRKSARFGGDERDDDARTLLEAFERESPGVREAVRATRDYVKAMTLLSMSKAERQALPSKSSIDAGTGGELHFADVFAAIAWDAGNPRPAAARGVLDNLLENEDPRAARAAAKAAQPRRRSLRQRLAVRTRVRALFAGLSS